MRGAVVLLFLCLSYSMFSQPSYLVEDNEKYTFSMICEDLKQLRSNHSSFVSLDTIGFSEFGLPLLCLKISNESPFKKYPIFIAGNIHAREDYSSKFVMKFANLFLLSLENKDSTYKSANDLLKTFDFYLLPVANPDGLKIAHEDWEGIEKFKENVLQLKLVGKLGDWKANGLGVDLNSNFDDGNHLYKCSSISQEFAASEGYKGCFPAEAKETIALQNFIQRIQPFLTLSFHTKGNVLFWGDCDTYEKYNGIDWKISSKVAQKTELKMMDLSYNPISYGCGMENYIRVKLDYLAVCVELSPMTSKRDQHPDNQFNKLVWSKCEQLPIIYLEELLKCQAQWPVQLRDYLKK